MPVTIEFGRAGGQIQNAGAGVEAGTAALSETLVPTGSNQVSANAAPATGGIDTPVVTVVADENIFIDIGAAPNATTNPRRALCAGMIRAFAVKVGDKVAVVTR